jgi:flavin reductase (DIM6/NTAB) family NADH-FMN oxidoreductase RutF
MTAIAQASPPVDRGAPIAPTDAAALRAALGQFATGVTIVTTTTDQGRPVGLTANSFTSVSMDPPLVLWSLSKRSGSLDAFRSAPHFAVNVLAASQQDLCDRFARRTDADRFEGVALSPSDQGLPVIEGALASFECSTYAQYEAGDHVVFLGRVEHHRAREGDALIFRAGRMLSSATLSA